jgi:hypothetical protein
VSASTTTTIRGVSFFARESTRKPDVFDVALSEEGITLQRPGRSEQRVTWARISGWEIEERPGSVVLTLRGGGSVTPLLVQGWTAEDLEAVMRDAAASGAEEAAGRPASRPVQPRAARRRAARRQHSVWKVLVTVVLLGVLATAVALVLLQSAGVISWGFLGPVA